MAYLVPIHIQPRAILDAVLSEAACAHLISSEVHSHVFLREKRQREERGEAGPPVSGGPRLEAKRHMEC